MNIRLPINVFDRAPEKRGPTGKYFAVGVNDAEFGDDVDVDSDPAGFLPDGFARVGSIAGPITDALDDEGYGADDFEFEGRQGGIVMWAIVEDDPADSEGTEWVTFEVAE